MITWSKSHCSYCMKSITKWSSHHLLLNLRSVHQLDTVMQLYGTGTGIDGNRIYSNRNRSLLSWMFPLYPAYQRPFVDLILYTTIFKRNLGLLKGGGRCRWSAWKDGCHCVWAISMILRSMTRERARKAWSNGHDDTWDRMSSFPTSARDHWDMDVDQVIQLTLLLLMPQSLSNERYREYDDGQQNRPSPSSSPPRIIVSEIFPSNWQSPHRSRTELWKYHTQSANMDDDQRTLASRERIVFFNPPQEKESKFSMKK